MSPRAIDRAFALTGLAALQLWSCGGGSSDPCPTGNCVVPANTLVKFMFDHYPERMFNMDSCSDLGIVKVHVDAVDAAGAVTSLEVDCGAAQATFQGLAEGMYTVYVDPVDGGGNSLVKAPIAGTVMAGTTAMMSQTTVYVPWDAWVGPYTGTFLFRLSWDGKSCTTATPPVAMQLLKLTVGGTVVSEMTDSGQRLDGTDWKPCRPLEDTAPQYAKDLPFGPGKLTVTGKDATGKVAFDNDIDVFVGAGISNPTITFNVTVDAGVDAPPDAPIDAPIDAPSDAPTDGASLD